MGKPRAPLFVAARRRRHTVPHGERLTGLCLGRAQSEKAISRIVRKAMTPSRPPPGPSRSQLPPDRDIDILYR